MPQSIHRLYSYLHKLNVQELRILSKYFYRRITKQTGGYYNKQQLIHQLLIGGATTKVEHSYEYKLLTKKLVSQPDSSDLMPSYMIDSSIGTKDNYNHVCICNKPQNWCICTSKVDFKWQGIRNGTQKEEDRYPNKEWLSDHVAVITEATVDGNKYNVGTWNMAGQADNWLEFSTSNNSKILNLFAKKCLEFLFTDGANENIFNGFAAATADVQPADIHIDKTNLPGWATRIIGNTKKERNIKEINIQHDEINDTNPIKLHEHFGIGFMSKPGVETIMTKKGMDQYITDYERIFNKYNSNLGTDIDATNEIKHKHIIDQLNVYFAYAIIIGIINEVTFDISGSAITPMLIQVTKLIAYA